VADFDYSGALRKQAGSWDRDKLDRWLTAPQQFAPGTLMTLGGVRNAADRKVVLDFLETLTAESAAQVPGADAQPNEQGSD
jgi:cytochrome c